MIGEIASTVAIDQTLKCSLDLEPASNGQEGVRQMKQQVAMDHLCPTPGAALAHPYGGQSARDALSSEPLVQSLPYFPEKQTIWVVPDGCHQITGASSGNPRRAFDGGVGLAWQLQALTPKQILGSLAGLWHFTLPPVSTRWSRLNHRLRAAGPIFSVEPQRLPTMSPCRFRHDIGTPNALQTSGLHLTGVPFEHRHPISSKGMPAGLA